MDDLDLDQPIGHDPRWTRKEVRRLKRKRLSTPPCEPRYVSPEPALAFGFIGLCGLLLGLMWLTARVATVVNNTVAGGW